MWHRNEGRFMKKKLFAGLCVFVLSISIFTGCGNDDGTANNSATNGNENNTDDKDKNGTVADRGDNDNLGDDTDNRDDNTMNDNSTIGDNNTGNGTMGIQKLFINLPVTVSFTTLALNRTSAL